jgi:hypothetical protein
MDYFVTRECVASSIRKKRIERFRLFCRSGGNGESLSSTVTDEGADSAVR